MAKKKIVKPTPAEKVAIMIRLKRKYPQMFKYGSLKSDYTKKSKDFKTDRTKAIISSVKFSGMRQSEIDKFRFKKK